MDRCGWDNDGGSVGCCLPDGHGDVGVVHCPHVLGELTPVPRELVRRSDGRNVACVRVLNTRLDPAEATRDPL